jgi:hypothetical protein
MKNIKKKIKDAEIDFTSHHRFLRVRRDQFLPNFKKTHPIIHYTGEMSYDVEDTQGNQNIHPEKSVVRKNKIKLE